MENWTFCGVINIMKEAGYTSSDVVARLRGILHMKKIGHTGTLDPDATGVLPVCLGAATRLCGMLTDEDKEYECVCRLGVTTDTQDMSGTVLTSVPAESVAAAVGEEQLLEALRFFTGTYDQLPPMYSAVKIGGKKLYEYARRGVTVERKPRKVTIHEAELLSAELPLFRFRVRCSRGTYIRTLCADIGERLGTGAAMESLVRTRVGRCGLEEAVTLDAVERSMKEDPAAVRSMILPLEDFFQDLPRVQICGDDTAAKLLANGNRLECQRTDILQPDRELAELDGTCVRICDRDGTFRAVYRVDARNAVLIPEKMFLG